MPQLMYKENKENKNNSLNNNLKNNDLQFIITTFKTQHDKEKKIKPASYFLLVTNT